MNYGVIILAAGESSRMGTSKQLLTINSETLIRRTIKTVLAIQPINCTVVLGAEYEKHYQEIRDLPVDIIENSDWQKGIGSSIKVGIKNLSRNQLDAFFITVCDQPHLTAAHLIKISNAFKQSRATIVASGYNNTLGVPALFDWKVHQTLLKLPDQAGAKPVLLKLCDVIVNFDGGEIDLDTRQDYDSFVAKSL